jgi:mono/diheme cytochrome c family protein
MVISRKSIGIARRAAALAVVLFGAGTGYAQEKPSVVEGKELFGQYCVRCHGVGGTGAGVMPLPSRPSQPT